MRWRRMHREQDSRLAEARERADEAAGEVELSKERASRARETAVKPLRSREADNEFADLLRRSLQVGYGNGQR